MVKIITISREFGSGGRNRYAKDFIADESEYAPTSNGLAYMFLGRGLDGLSSADSF